MDASHHMVAIRELDLSNWHTTTLSHRINHAVPGLKESAAFFTFLRANLVLNPAAMSSNPNTPMLEPVHPYAIPTTSPSPLGAAPPLEPLDDIPPLSLDVLTEKADKTEALHLIADSIAQQRQQAAYALVSHPLCLAALSGAVGLAYHYSYVVRRDLGLTMMLVCGVVMTYLVAIRYASSGYIGLAEQLSWSFLRPDPNSTGSDEEDLVLGARFGNEVIAALVLRLEPNFSPHLSGKRRSRNSILRGGKGVIRAWTTRLKYRGQGVGADLLHQAVRVTKERCGRDAEVGFAQEHANSLMVLPELFNKPFRKREQRAAKALDGVLADWELSKKKR